MLYLNFLPEISITNYEYLNSNESSYDPNFKLLNILLKVAESAPPVS
jgi:hypothetical protein